LLGQVEVCLRNPRSSDEYRQVLDRVQRQGQNLRQIVEMLLFLARADADAVAEQLEHVDLTAWLPSYLNRWDDHLRAADLRIELPTVPADAMVQPALLGQLLDNLLDNAFKYSAPNTPVTVQLSASDRTICLSIADRATELRPRFAAPVRAVLSLRPRPPQRSHRRGPRLIGGPADCPRLRRTLSVASRIGDGSRFELTLEQL